MNLLIDSDIVIDVLRKRSTAIDLHQQLGTNNLLLSAVSVGEVYHGIRSGGNATQEKARFRRLIQNVDVVPFNFDLATVYGALRFRLRHAGIAPGDPDIMIAATAIQHDLTLATKNLRHFGRIEELKLYDWNTAPQ